MLAESGVQNPENDKNDDDVIIVRTSEIRTNLDGVGGSIIQIRKYDHVVLFAELSFGCDLQCFAAEHHFMTRQRHPLDIEPSLIERSNAGANLALQTRANCPAAKFGWVYLFFFYNSVLSAVSVSC